MRTLARCAVALAMAVVASTSSGDDWARLPWRDTPLVGGRLALPLGCKISYGEKGHSVVGKISCSYRDISIDFDIPREREIDFAWSCDMPSEPGWLLKHCMSRHGERVCCRVEPGDWKEACSGRLDREPMWKTPLAVQVIFPELGPASFRACVSSEDQAIAVVEVARGYTRKPLSK